jgi:hypothetical protein
LKEKIKSKVRKDVERFIEDKNDLKVLDKIRLLKFLDKNLMLKIIKIIKIKN